MNINGKTGSQFSVSEVFSGTAIDSKRITIRWKKHPQPCGTLILTSSNRPETVFDNWWAPVSYSCCFFFGPVLHVSHNIERTVEKWIAYIAAEIFEELIDVRCPTDVVFICKQRSCVECFIDRRVSSAKISDCAPKIGVNLYFLSTNSSRMLKFSACSPAWNAYVTFVVFWCSSRFQIALSYKTLNYWNPQRGPWNASKARGVHWLFYASKLNTIREKSKESDIWNTIKLLF